MITMHLRYDSDPLNRKVAVAVIVETTPNPRAMKFTVGTPVGGPATFVDSASADESVAPILDIDGVRSVFMTGDFVTVTRTEQSSWDSIVDAVVVVLESSFG
jgi:hypothetical protein